MRCVGSSPAAAASALRNRLAAFAAGLGVTAILQSSTATGLMVAGFASLGLVDVNLSPKPALAPWDSLFALPRRP